MARSVLVLESPWQESPNGVKTHSVRPFVEGMGHVCRYETHYAMFYKNESFKDGMEYLLRCQEGRKLMYIAAHGLADRSNGVVGDADLDFLIGCLSKKKIRKIKSMA